MESSKAQEFDYTPSSDLSYIIHEKGRPFYLFEDAVIGNVKDEEVARLFSITPLLFEVYQEVVYYYLSRNKCACVPMRDKDKSYRCNFCLVKVRDRRIRTVMGLDD